MFYAIVFKVYFGLFRPNLISEEKDLGAVRIPSELHEKQQMLRGMLSVRIPKPISDKFIEVQNKELQQQLIERGIVSLEEIHPMRKINGKCLLLWQGDITRLKVDAIVNAANSRMLGCFIPFHRCIDNAIHSAAGIQLRMECDELMKQQGFEEPTGVAKITKGYNLPSKYVIHTVGPIISCEIPTYSQCEDLVHCYRSCMEVAEQYQLKSIAFCCISTGEFRFPHQLAAEIALQTVEQFKTRSLNTIVFNVFKDEDYLIYKQLLSE